MEAALGGRTYVVEQEREEHVVLAFAEPRQARAVELRFRNSALRPVSGWVTTTLCSTGGHRLLHLGEIEGGVPVVDRLL